MKWTRRTKTLVVILLALALIVCAGLLEKLLRPTPPEQVIEAAGPPPVTETPSAPPELTADYQSPVDFAALQAANPDIYAWLTIPGTEISYPLLQRASDDSFYLNHDAEQRENANGALYTEGAYNGITFDDPVTVVYGHHMRDGAMFGNLQETYADAANFSRYGDILIYLPQRELRFAVFAAVPYDNRHLLYNYDFSQARTFRLFFDDVLSIRAIEANYAEEVQVAAGDQVLVLSTCLIADRTHRYLVFAKLVEETPPAGSAN